MVYGGIQGLYGNGLIWALRLSIHPTRILQQYHHLTWPHLGHQFAITQTASTSCVRLRLLTDALTVCTEAEKPALHLYLQPSTNIQTELEFSWKTQTQ